MGTDYDRLYRETPHALGAPNADVARFFTGLGGPVKVLDIGCGQGWDALALARAGHRVHGVDLSPAGIAQMLQEAETEGLPLTGEVADITEWIPAGEVDVLLIDRTLHMLPGEATRIRVLAALLPAVRPGAGCSCWTSRPTWPPSATASARAGGRSSGARHATRTGPRPARSLPAGPADAAFRVTPASGAGYLAPKGGP